MHGVYHAITRFETEEQKSKCGWGKIFCISYAWVSKMMQLDGLYAIAYQGLFRLKNAEPKYITASLRL